MGHRDRTVNNQRVEGAPVGDPARNASVAGLANALKSDLRLASRRGVWFGKVDSNGQL
jgi:hypothetical protein